MYHYSWSKQSQHSRSFTIQNYFPAIIILINQSMKFLGAFQRITRPFWTTPLLRGFSEAAAGNGSIPKIYQDWQYCKMITRQLRDNNINNAISLLFQSYLNNKVLDIQIYNQLQEKIIDSSLPLSYAEILYTIYRDHFPPHALMSNWMEKLTASECQDFIDKLKKDYEALGKPFPLQTQKTSRRQARRQVKSEKVQVATNNEEEAPKTGKRPRNAKPYTSTYSSVQIPNIDVPKLEAEMSPAELYQAKLSAEVKNVLSGLNIDMNSFSRIVVHDVTIEFGMDDEDISNEENASEEQEFQEQDLQNLGMLGFDIKNIKIGRVQFFNDHRKEQ